MFRVYQKYFVGCLLITFTMSQPGCQIKDSENTSQSAAMFESPGRERQLTRGPGGRVLTNTGVWSPDGKWIVYDTRQIDFDGDTIEMVNVHTGEVRDLYRSKNGAHCGVVTFNPRQNKVVFILGPENPTTDWEYGMFHRQGVIVATDNHDGKSAVVHLDARDITPPFTPGALRGGSHVHVWDAAGEWVSFTYEDHVMAQFKETTPDNDINLRNIGVSMSGRTVKVNQDHARNHDADYFTVLVTRTKANPEPGSDEIKKAFEEGWIGTNGYRRLDGTLQNRALAFQGHVVTAKKQTVAEVFIVDLPDDLTQPGDGPLAGTETRLPSPPKGCVQRRLTFTGDQKFPGIEGPRHWLRSSPDGSQIAFLMKDDDGIVQLWTVSPNGGSPRQVSSNSSSIASSFTWSPNGQYLAHAMDNSICVTEIASGKTHRLTPRTDDATAPRSEACVFSPDGKALAYLRPVAESGRFNNQIFVVSLKN